MIIAVFSSVAVNTMDKLQFLVLISDCTCLISNRLGAISL